MRSRALGIAALFLLPNLLGFLAFTLFPVVASFRLELLPLGPGGPAGQRH